MFVFSVRNTIAGLIGAISYWAFGMHAFAQPVSEEANRLAVARIHSVETGTAFVIFTSGRKLYLLTAAHVVGGDQPANPPCRIDFDNPAIQIPCKVPYLWVKEGMIDLAVIEADASNVSGSFAAARLGDSGLLPNNGAKVYTLGYTGGGPLRRKDGVTSGTEAPQMILNGIVPHGGDSGSPVFSEADGLVVGIITDRTRASVEQRASEIDQIKLYLRREALFRALVQFNRPAAGATGPLVASDLGPSLTSIFANQASPERWYERAKRYTRTEVDMPGVYGSESWLGVRRIYVSAFNDKVGHFGRGWSTMYDYRIDVEHSSLCRLYFWNPRGVRVALDSLVDCAEMKRGLAAAVKDAKLLDRPLQEILAVDDVSQRVLPDNGPSYVGADYQVARLRYVANGFELTIGSTKYGFNVQGKLRSLRSFGRTVELDYDARGRLAVFRDGARTQEFGYVDRGRVGTVRFGDGSQYEYKYDAFDNLVRATKPGGEETVYSYDKEHRLVGIQSADAKRARTIAYDARGWRTAVQKDNKEFRWSFVDDLNGMPSVKQDIVNAGNITERREYRFDYQERVLDLATERGSTRYTLTQCLCLPFTTETDGLKVTYQYDPFGRITEILRSDVTHRFAYDDRVNKVKKVEAFSGGKKIVDAEVEYDAFGNIIKAKAPLDHQELVLTYDSNNRVSTIVNSRGKRVRIEYNRIGKPVNVEVSDLGEIRISYKTNGDIEKVSSENGPNVALQVASTFNNLLDIIAPFTNQNMIDTKFSLITSEPDGCDDCSRLVDF
jgi:YD repeat-containing protein